MSRSPYIAGRSPLLSAVMSQPLLLSDVPSIQWNCNLWAPRAHQDSILTHCQHWRPYHLAYSMLSHSRIYAHLKLVVYDSFMRSSSHSWHSQIAPWRRDFGRWSEDETWAASGVHCPYSFSRSCSIMISSILFEIFCTRNCYPLFQYDIKFRRILSSCFLHYHYALRRNRAVLHRKQSSSYLTLASSLVSWAIQPLQHIHPSLHCHKHT